jgi:MraZ protein
LAFFRGIHDHSLDAKNRLTVPSKFRAQLAGPIVLGKGLEPCLQVFPEAAFDQIAEAALAGVNPFSEQARELDRYFFGSFTPAELDSAGRIMLPKEFMEYAGITKDAKVVGAGRRLEIWDRARWQQYDAKLIPRANEHIERVGNAA